MTASLRALLEGVVDYAGLFPPAGLSMAEAVRNYAGYRTGADAWMLGRFILPVSRLAEFEAEAVQHDLGDWRLSVLGEDAAAVGAFNARHKDVVIDAMETKASTIEAIEALRPAIPGSIDVYVEIPIDQDPTTLIEVIARTGCRAKMRTGATSPDGFPPAQDVARFMARCLALKVPFKATAGLHHPLRSVHPVTYEKDAPTACMHGFLNVFLAAALMASGTWEAAAAEMLEDKHLYFNEECAGWRDHSVSAKDIRQARRYAVSFGSCSFAEPLADLQSLKLL
ncbi:MAG: hypothetical protein ACYCW6_13555 [Candidatus Xenobia bacterium]